MSDDEDIFYTAVEDKEHLTLYEDHFSEEMATIKYQLLSEDVLRLTNISFNRIPITAGEVKNEIARHLRTSKHEIDIVAAGDGIIYCDGDPIQIQKTTEVIRHPTDRVPSVDMMTSLPDVTDPDIDDPRVLMSCGHAMTPENVYMSATVALKDGSCVIKCFDCGEIWDFEEVAKKSIMSQDERIFWGSKITLNTLNAEEHLDVTECPKCRSYCQRYEKSQNSARCLVCSKNGPAYDFCWYCKETWTNAHRCETRTREEIQNMLNTCSRKTMGYSNIPDVPSLRLCPNCGTLIEHAEACKQTPCTRCKIQFCFVCLTVCEKGVLQCTQYNKSCTVAPVQIA